jgi:CheY-like chemotaxis protein
MGDGARKRVLVVEDEDMVREIVTWAIEDLGFDVVGASSGEEAVGLLGSADVDLLLTDIRMPGAVDGWTLGERARAVMPDLPIIYVSGYSHEPPRMLARSVFLQKPLRTDALRKAIEDVGLL